MKNLFGLTTLIALFTSSFTPEIKDLHFLAGTWKVQNKENYETWTLKEKELLEGNSYKIRNGNKQIDEYLSIKASGDKIIYTAKVMNQNKISITETLSVTGSNATIKNRKHK